MSPSRLGAILGAISMTGASGMAAASTFTWNPHAVQLNGGKLTADTLVLHDYAKITFGEGNTFTDTGTLPIIGFRLNGHPCDGPGLSRSLG